MIKFFRHIRKTLIEKNNMGKYFKYAIGEIILVVIGILIALQINNWNESKKELKQITSVLLEIRTNLVTDNTALSQLIKLTEEDINIQRKVISRLKSETPLDSSLNPYYGRLLLMRPINLITSGYSLLKDLGIGKIKDETLRNKLVQYYETDIFRINKNIKDDDQEFLSVLLPFIRNNFLEWEYGKGGVPINYSKLQKSQYFITSMTMNLTNASATVRDLKKGHANLKEILPLIDKYLDAQ